jgi:hypothetical protein
MRILIVQPVGHAVGHHSYYTRRLSESLAQLGRVSRVTVVSYAGFRNQWDAGPKLHCVQVEQADSNDWFPALEPKRWAANTVATLEAARPLFDDHDSIRSAIRT